MTTLPLDVDSLLGELEDPRSEPFHGLPSGTVMGHVHLKVAQIRRDDRLLPRVPGFALMAQLGPLRGVSQRRRLSPPHRREHLRERGGHPAPPGSAALRHATIVLPDEAEPEHVLGRLETSGQVPQQDAGGVVIRDPSGNALALAIA